MAFVPIGQIFSNLAEVSELISVESHIRLGRATRDLL